MSGKLVGSRVKRNEDARLLTGRAMFVDDVDLPGMLHVAFLRSPTLTRASEHRRRRRERHRACLPFTPPTTSATTGSPGRCSCRRRRSTA